MLEHLKKRINETLKAIQQHFDDNDDLRGQRDLLTNINGIADTTAALILAELGDIQRFEAAVQ
ncbi:transposase [Pseudomonas sp. TTU2014-080ASC]|uniref:transposase n=1 Tax=Pseudomonas sp. TTU2014-080ASC TaxID=1729724 RepID=UPI00071853E8|nr:hypothetical protein AO726_01270 [Pseudomonas sp. TTU2014-080ASC]